MRKDCWGTVKPNWSQVAGSAQGLVYTAVHTGLALKSSNGWEWEVNPLGMENETSYQWAKFSLYFGALKTSRAEWGQL